MRDGVQILSDMMFCVIKRRGLGADSQDVAVIQDGLFQGLRECVQKAAKCFGGLVLRVVFASLIEAMNKLIWHILSHFV